MTADGGDTTPVLTVPKDATGRHQLIAGRPSHWEYLLFASYLLEGQARLEPKWRDSQIDYVVSSGDPIPKASVLGFLRTQLDLIPPMARNTERVLSPEATLAAFGAPGEPGDPTAIEHLASRLLSTYEAFLDWAADTRGARVPSEVTRVTLVMSHFAKEPIKNVREFIAAVSSTLEDAIALEASGHNDPIHIEVSLTLKDNPDVRARYDEELKFLGRYLKS